MYKLRYSSSGFDLCIPDDGVVDLVRRDASVINLVANLNGCPASNSDRLRSLPKLLSSFMRIYGTSLSVPTEVLSHSVPSQQESGCRYPTTGDRHMLTLNSP